MLNFQRLEVYQESIKFLAFVSELAEEMPRGNAERVDQLVRAAESVPRNIGEAAGRWSAADAKKHFRIARGEAMECAASLDVMRVRGLIRSERYDVGMATLESVVRMLSKLV